MGHAGKWCEELRVDTCYATCFLATEHGPKITDVFELKCDIDTKRWMNPEIGVFLKPYPDVGRADVTNPEINKYPHGIYCSPKREDVTLFIMAYAQAVKFMNLEPVSHVAV